MHFSNIITPLSLLGSLALASPPPGSGPRINLAPSPDPSSTSRKSIRSSQVGFVVVSSLCGFPVYISTAAGQETLYSKMLPLSFPYPPVGQLTSIRISTSAPTEDISISPVFQLDVTRNQDGRSGYNAFNIDGVPFEQYGLTVACEEKIAKRAEEGGSCDADSNIIVTLCTGA